MLRHSRRLPLLIISILSVALIAACGVEQEEDDVSPDDVDVAESISNTLYVDLRLAADCTQGNYSATARACTGTQGNAYTTIQKAANLVSPGTTVLVRGGRYPAFSFTNKRGSNVAPITVKPYPGEKVIVDRYLSATSVLRAIEFFSGSSYITIEGLEVTDSDPLIDLYRSCDVINNTQACSDILLANFKGRGGIKINHSVDQPAESITLKNLAIHHNAGTGIGIKGLRLSILDNDIYDNGVIGEGYGMYLYGDGLVIKGNRSHDNNGHGIRVGSDGGASGYVTNSVIEANVLHDNTRPFIHYVNFTEPVLIRNGGSGLVLWHGHSNIIHNNIIYNNGNYGVQLNGDSPFNNQVLNNTISGNGSYGIYVYDDEANLLHNNISVANGRGPLYLGRGNIASSNLLTEPAGFLDAAAFDFRLRADSPARDRGISLAAVPVDHDGVRRPQGPAYDMGAYEYVAPSAVPAAPNGLTATAVSSSAIDLTWTDNSSNESGFWIERRTPNGYGTSGTYAQIAAVGAGVRTYRSSGLVEATTYQYRVRAYNSAGTSAYSNEASATTEPLYVIAE